MFGYVPLTRAYASAIYAYISTTCYCDKAVMWCGATADSKAESSSSDVVVRTWR